MYSGVSLSGIPDNETPNLVFRYPDKFYPENRGLVIRQIKAIPVFVRILRPMIGVSLSGRIPDNETLFSCIKMALQRRTIAIYANI